ncbi:MAG: MFS transporter [Anaerolineae bacterium]
MAHILQAAGVAGWLRQLRGYIAPTGPNDAERNARLLEIEVFWAAFLSAAAAFNAAYALRLGATNAQIGLLSSIPALITLLITIPAGQFLNRRGRRMPWVIGSLALARLGYLAVALIPFLNRPDAGTLVVWTLIGLAAPAAFFGVGWNSMLADVVPEAKRARLFAVRNIVLAIVVTAGTFVAGRWLNATHPPLNYQVVYLVGFFGAVLSTLYIMQMRVPDSPVTAAATSSLSPRALWVGGREAFRRQPDFTRIVLNTLAHGIGLWMVGPVYVLYYVRQLGASDGWIGTNAMVANLTPILGYYFWQRMIARRGENWVLRLTISLIGLYPILVGLTPNLTIILLWTGLQGLIAPGINLGHFPLLLKICPAESRPLHIGIYTTIMNIGAFVMPLVGVAQTEWVGYRPVLIAGGVLCLLGSSLFRWRPLQTPDSLAVRSA